MIAEIRKLVPDPNQAKIVLWERKSYSGSRNRLYSY
jgi:hypothetical protein